jgi:hypothetical protein
MSLSGFIFIGNPEADFFIMATLAIPFAAIVGCRKDGSMNKVPAAIMLRYCHSSSAEKQRNDY